MADNEEPKKIPIVLGPGFLKEMEEKNHYGLFRQTIAKLPGGDQSVGPPIGPLFVYRKCAKDEKEEIWTYDSVTGQRVSLKLIFDARNGGQEIK